MSNSWWLGELQPARLQQEHWNRLPFPPSENLPNPRVKPGSPELTGGFLTTEPPGKPIRSLWIGKVTFQWRNMAGVSLTKWLGRKKHDQVFPDITLLTRLLSICLSLCEPYWPETYQYAFRERERDNYHHCVKLLALKIDQSFIIQLMIVVVHIFVPTLCIL